VSLQIQILAIDTEKQIKKWSQAKKEALINNDYDALPNLAKKNLTDNTIAASLRVIISYSNASFNNV
jgi:putative endonuclease